MSIPVEQSKGIFTQAYLKAWKDNIPAQSFLKSFFDVKTFATKYVGIEVQRGTERMAVDVIRGVNGNRNTFSKSSEKVYLPPFFNENFDATDLDRYDRVFGSDVSKTPATIGYLASEVAAKYLALQDKIERAKEKQAAEVFHTGIVTIKNGDNVDYKRKSDSKVDLTGAGGYWTTTTTDIESQLIAGAEFVRNNGKNATAEFNLVMSGASWVSMKKNDYFKNNANYNQVSLLDINFPQAKSTGASYHGKITAGAYIFNVWTYDGVYENASGTITRYLPANISFMTPVQGTRFDMVHAGVPAIIRGTKKAEFGSMIVQKASEYYLNNYIDQIGKAHIFEIYSAPLAVPISVDMIYTMQVSA